MPTDHGMRTCGSCGAISIMPMERCPRCGGEMRAPKGATKKTEPKPRAETIEDILFNEEKT